MLNVGSAHVGEFGSRDQHRRAPRPSCRGAARPRACPSSTPTTPSSPPWRAGSPPRAALRAAAEADVRAEDVALDERGRAAYTLVCPQGTARVSLRQSGAHQVGNSLAVAAAALELGLSLDQVVAGLSERPWR